MIVFFLVRKIFDETKKNFTLYCFQKKTNNKFLFLCTNESYVRYWQHVEKLSKKFNIPTPLPPLKKLASKLWKCSRVKVFLFFFFEMSKMVFD